MEGSSSVDFNYSEKMEALEEVLILLQRRYNILRDVKQSTDELGDALSRKDDVSAELIMDMRQDLLGKCDLSWQEIYLLQEKGTIYKEILKRLVFSDLSSIHPKDRMERKLLEIRQHNQKLIKDIQEKDKAISMHIAKSQSFYSS